MKSKKVLPLISLLFVALMLFSVGMIVKEHRERQQDIKGFEKLEEIITEAEKRNLRIMLNKPIYRRNRNSPHAI